MAISLQLTHKYVDFFKIGKLNHMPKYETQINWTSFLNETINRMRRYNKQFYIKNDLYKFANNETILFPHERDMDYLALKNTFEN